ncbi:amino acid ABC transporter permease [Labrys monachus]|uniref:General L-amino acid transport system permease protein n=1 Tax=Labrys monachus TaxID=217067 RepID=A0ABU0FIB2_9HYPH|nr:amino acid ABC transporter permease [Labrys monachus]MDQ0394216.1 general L-amino acid transport system permease protein [Labrys monachus]
MSQPSLSRAQRPVWSDRWQQWRAGLFSSPVNTVITLVVLAVAAWIAVPLIRWALIDATWTGTAQDCQARSGACWAFIHANIKLILFGTYPGDMLWRPIVTLVLLFGLVIASTLPAFWGIPLVVAWIAIPTLACLLLSGFLSGTDVSTNQWGGLPLTMLIATIAFAAAFPVAILMALGRRSKMGGIRLICVAAIEVLRGIPMLVVLYVSILIVPMMLPRFNVNLFFSVEVALTLFVSSYLAEIVRAGIQSLPAGQNEAARALGLSYRHAFQLVILPQALRSVIPAIVNLAIGLIQNTPLVVAIGMMDFLSAGRAAAQNEQIWPNCFNEAYFFAGIVYFGLCFGASRYSLWLEGRLRASTGYQTRIRGGLTP